jgi:hypothetical protein
MGWEATTQHIARLIMQKMALRVAIAIFLNSPIMANGRGEKY